jgi:hypothetical protein
MVHRGNKGRELGYLIERIFPLDLEFGGRVGINPEGVDG